LADTENIRDDNVLSLRLKMLNKDKKGGGKPVEEMILKEIASRPHDVGLRIRLVNFLLEEKRFSEAFKYCFDLEMKFMEIFLLSVDWYSTVSSVLAQSTTTDNWNYWCLLLISLDKKIYLNLKKDLSLQAIKQTNIKDVTNLLFDFDQVLKKAVDSLLILAPVKELAEEFINHFRGQMALHIASLLFQKQKVSNNDQWRETTKKCLPFLLFAFQCSTVNTDAFWLKNTNETIRNLFAYLKKEGAFRCAQAGRTILACKSRASDDITMSSRNQKSWLTIDDIFNQVRESCVDLNWRKNVYRQLYANADQQTKVSTSYFIQSSFFQEPKYEIISFNDVEHHEDVAQFLYPSSLEHHVYLGLGRKDLHSYKSHTFSKLNLSASNILNCNPETINRIDVDSFLYCSVIQAKRRLEAEKDCYESFSNKPNEKPLLLPAANMVEGLCTEEQCDWWLSAFKIYKNITGDNLAQLKATLQFGIEAVRGIDSPKVDVIILLKLGDTLLARTGSSEKVEERRHFELRAEYVYKMAMRMMKSRESENMRRIFKFATSNFDMERETDHLAGNAIGHLSSIYFKREEYKEFIEDFTGLSNPWAHFFRAEAYKKLDESSKTPKKSRKLYVEKARDSLIQTLSLLDENGDVGKNHPLRSRVEKELKKMQYNLSTSFNDELDFHDTSNGHVDDEIFHNASSTSFRGRRDLSMSAITQNYNEKFNEVESLIRKLSDLVVSVKDDVLCVRNDISDLKNEMLNIRGDIADMNVNKDALSTKALTDVYKAVEDLTWNVTYVMNMMQNPAAGVPQRFPPNTVQAQISQMYNTAYPMFPMQYSAPSMVQQQRPPPQAPAAQLAYDPLGQNLMMGQTNGILAMQNQPKSSLLEALNTPTLLNTWNNTYNQQQPITPPSQAPLHTIPAPAPMIPATIQNKPVEKAPPVNVVITSSDPLPAQNSFVSQPTLSVTIPPQHIKHGPQQTFPKQPQYENISPVKHDTSEYLEEPADYDPRPDFKPIIPLPDEIEVKTGEENEEVMFSERCKLFRMAEAEWKERGIGNIKILKSKENGKYRILMRREQIHKLCANHAITPELELKPTAKETQMMWGANDFSEEEMKTEKFLVRFKHAEQAKKFKEAFEDAKKNTKATPVKATKPKEVVKSKENEAKVRRKPNFLLQKSNNAFDSFTAQNHRTNLRLACSFNSISRHQQHAKVDILIRRSHGELDVFDWTLRHTINASGQVEGRQEQTTSTTKSLRQLHLWTGFGQQILL
jgi:E3 SUMO-protein ligase RanBP2